MNKVKVGAVSYLNTKPLIYGFQQGEMGNEIILIEDYPSRIADMLLSDEIDIGLVPVAILPLLKEAHIISDYCIGATGAVASVCLFSDVPIQEIKEILLDNQSRTSVQLVTLLLKEYWKINPLIINAQEGYREKIKGTTAGLVIGDRAFEQKKKSAYAYDLAEAWVQLTGLPFVFAAWVSNKKLDEKFIAAFNATTSIGLQHVDAIIAQNPYTLFNLKEYYHKHISYNLDAAKKQGLALFLEKVA